MDLHRIQSAFKYFIRARGKAFLHSPFLYEFSERVLAKDPYYDFGELNAIRKALEKNDTVLDIEDFGAGSTKGHGNQRAVSRIARTSVKRAKYAQILYRLANWQNAKAMLELGTSLGLTTLHLAKACPSADMVTLEGSPSLVSFSRELFHAKGCGHIQSVQGRFEDQLPQVAPTREWDLLFIDGNHRYQPTIDAVQTTLSYASPDAVYVIDDIYWSKEMTRAWEELKANSAFTLSIDLFEMGLLFCGLGMEKQHKVLRV